MADPIRLPLFSPLTQRDTTSDKDALATNVFYDHIESTSYATKRPGISTYASGLGQGLGIYYYDNELFIFEGVENTTWVDLTSGNGVFVMKQSEALTSGSNYTTNKTLSSEYGRRWNGISLPADWKFAGLAFGNGVFVIGATYKSPVNAPPVLSDTYFYSIDGYNWQPTNTVGSTTDVLFLNNKFFSTGNLPYSNPKHSTNGITWTDYTGAQGVTLSTTTWSGLVYCSVENSNSGGSTWTPFSIKTSPDALIWTSQISIGGDRRQATDIASNTALGTMVISEGKGVVHYSTNSGVNWTTVTLPTVNPGDGGVRIKFINSLFTLLMDSGAFLTSPDGITWTFKSYITGAPSTLFSDFAYMNGQYVVTLRTDTNAFYYSPDLITWTIGNLREPQLASITIG
jgi:hypothetical protein